MSARPMLVIRDLEKHFGGIVATKNINLEILAGEIHAIIGPNGSGKTTLISQLSGSLRPDSGKILFDGRDITRLSEPARSLRGLARTFQVTRIFLDFTALENVSLAIQAHVGHSYRFWTPTKTDRSLVDPARAILVRIGLGEQTDVIAGNLSHGAQRQLEIAMALATRPKLLLLDEPMAGMGTEDSETMTGFLKSLKGDYTMLLVEHDMDAVFALADRISVLVYGSIIATGTPSEIRDNDEVRHAYLGDDEAA